MAEEKELNEQIDEVQASFILAQVKEAYERTKEQMQPFHDEMKRLFAATYVMKGERANGSNFFFPKAFEHVDRIKSTLLGDSPKFKTNPLINKNPLKPEQDIVGYARAIELGLQHFWNAYNSQDELDSIVSAGLSQRVSYARVHFKQKLMKVDSGGHEMEEVIAEYPCFESLDPLRVFFDPTIPRWDDLPFVIYAAGKVRKSDLINSDKSMNVDKIEKLASSGKLDSENSINEKFQGQGFVLNQSSNSDNDWVDVIEYYGLLKLNQSDSVEDERLYKVHVAGDSVIIRLEPIKFIPIECFTPFKIPNQIIGHGITSLIEQAQRAYNLMRSMRFDNIGLTVNQMFKYKIGSGINVKYLRSRQGGIIPMKNLDDVQPLQIPDVTGNSFNETNSLGTEMQQIAATIDPTQASTQNSFTNTATGESIRYNIFQQRVRKIRSSLENFMGRVGRKMLLRIAEEQKARSITVYDEQLKQFYQVVDDVFDNIDDFYSVSVVMGSTAFDSPENERDEALALAQLAIAFKAQGVNINMTPVAKNALSTFKKANIEEIILDEPPAEQNRGGGQIPQSVIDQVSRTGETIDEQFNKQINEKLG